MNIVQIGACIGSDDLTSLIGNSQPELLVLVEPMVLHNQKLLECYSHVEHKEIENSAITVGDQENTILYYHVDDGPLYEVTNVTIPHITKHGYDIQGIRELSVKSLTINKLFEKYRLSHIDILFMDTEGTDDVLIKSIDFERFHIDQIFFENIHLTQPDIYEFLESKGYEIIRHWGYEGWTSVAKISPGKNI